MKRFKLKTWLGAGFLIAALLARADAALAQGTDPGQFMVPLGYCQQTLSSSVVSLSACVRASFTASAGANSTQLVVTAVTGIIKTGDQIVTGTGVTVGTIITGQVSGTPGGAGTYQLNATNTASAATVTSGGVPTGARMAYITVSGTSVNAVYRDDGGAPTTAIGVIISSGTGILYTGTLSALQFIAASGSPVLNVSFYK